MKRTIDRLNILAMSIAVTFLAWAVPTHAGAAAQLGQVGIVGTGCGANLNFVQKEATVPYEVPFPGGVITQWTHRGRDGGPAGSGRLQVWRQIGPEGTFIDFQLVGRSAVQSFTTSAIRSFSTRVPVRSGDLLGMRSTSADTGCRTSTGGGYSLYSAVSSSDPAPGETQTFGPAGAPPSFQLNVSALLEPDGDSDGYGDETQDQCVGQSGPSNGCPATPPPAPPSNDFSFGKLKKNKKKGTAKAKVKVPGPGEIELAKNKKVKGKAKSADETGTVKVPIKPKGKAKKKLNKKGKTKVKAEFTYTPDGGEPNTKTKKVGLKKK